MFNRGNLLLADKLVCPHGAETTQEGGTTGRQQCSQVGRKSY